MTKAVDWDALQAVFKPLKPSTTADAPPVCSADTVTYNNEQMPRCLACDLMRERAAIHEYDAGLSCAEVEVFD